MGCFHLKKDDYSEEYNFVIPRRKTYMYQDLHEQPTLLKYKQTMYWRLRQWQMKQPGTLLSSLKDFHPVFVVVKSHIHRSYMWKQNNQLRVYLLNWRKIRTTPSISLFSVYLYVFTFDWWVFIAYPEYVTHVV